MDNKIFPFIGVPDDYIRPSSDVLPLFKELAWDFKNNDYKLNENKEFIILEGVEALEVWIYMAIKTIRYAHEIYSHDYGTELTQLIGQRFTRGLTESEAFRYCKECLEINPYINDVKNRGVEFKGDTLYIKLLVNSIYGEIEVDRIV